MEVCKEEKCVIMTCPENVDDPHATLVHDPTHDSHVQKCKQGFYFESDSPEKERQTQIPVTCKFVPELGKKQWVPKDEENIEQRLVYSIPFSETFENFFCAQILLQGMPRRERLRRGRGLHEVDAQGVQFVRAQQMPK